LVSIIAGQERVAGYVSEIRCVLKWQDRTWETSILDH
jgi:hypothetical protein